MVAADDIVCGLCFPFSENVNRLLVVLLRSFKKQNNLKMSSVAVYALFISTELKVSYCDHRMSVVRPSDAC